MAEEIVTSNQNTSVPIPTPPLVTPPREQKTKKWSMLLLFLPLLLIPAIAGIFLLNSRESVTTIPSIVKNKELTTVNNISPTPMPFREMTIPYLRERTYTSTLGNIEEVYSGGSYTAYLTHYTSDGLRINALLTKPQGEMPEGGWPAIVFIHGYIPPTQYETNGQAYSSYVDYLANNGFVVLKIDLRGHGTSDGEAGGGYFGADYVIDALNAYAALESADFINKAKIGMWGHSMAGNILLRSVAARPSIPAVAVWAGAVYSYTDMQKYGIQDSSYRPPTTVTRQQNRRRELFEKHGSASATSVFWQQVAPTNYLKDFKGAIEIHHAIDDDVVTIGYSRDLVALLKSNNVQHSFYEYELGGHNISGNNFNIAMSRTVDFFATYLK